MARRSSARVDNVDSVLCGMVGKKIVAVLEKQWPSGGNDPHILALKAHYFMLLRFIA